ncbi:MAG: hypothetical protein KDE20_29230, partial [Caldilineaceae bacterium]|nr:hypothetical protein [Caldilineaceae bacterium]
DAVVPPRYAQEFHAGIPGSLLAMLPDCGHVPQWECPEAFGAALANYLGLEGFRPANPPLARAEPPR